MLRQIIRRASQLLDLRRETGHPRHFEASFNSATNSDPGTFVMWNHFSSFPSVRFRRPGGDVRRESQSSSTEPVFLIPSGVRLGTAEAGGRLGESRVVFLGGTSFPRPLAWIGVEGKLGGHACGVGTL